MVRGRDDDLVGRARIQRRHHHLQLVSGFLEVELEADSSPGDLQHVRESHGIVARSDLVMGQDNDAAGIAAEVDLDEVSTAVEPSRIARMRADQHT